MAKKKSNLPTYAEYKNQNPTNGNSNLQTFESYQKQKQTEEKKRQTTNSLWKDVYKAQRQRDAEKARQRYATLVAGNKLYSSLDEQKQTKQSTGNMLRGIENITGQPFSKREKFELTKEAVTGKQPKVTGPENSAVINDQRKALNEYLNQRMRKAQEAKAQMDTTYQGVKASREENGAGNQFGVNEYIGIQQQNKANQQKGLMDNGSDPRYMSDEGLEKYKAGFQKKYDTAKADIEEINRQKGLKDNYKPWESWGTQVYDYLHGLGVQNEDTILNGEGYTQEQKQYAQRKKEDLNAGYQSGLDEMLEDARSFYNNEYVGGGFAGTNYDQQNMRELAYEQIMGESYADRVSKMTPEQKAELDSRIDKAIGGFTNPYDTGRDYEGEIRSRQKEADAYMQQVQAAEDLQASRGRIARYAQQAEQTGLSGEYNTELNPEIKMVYNDMLQDDMPSPQGTAADKAYFWANNYQNYPELLNNVTEPNKYMFVRALGDDVLNQFNTLYAFDKENGTRAAESFIQAIDPYLSTCLSEYQDWWTRTRAEDPVAGTVGRIMSPALNAVGGLMGTIGSAAAALGVESAKDSTSGWYSTTRFVNTLRSQQNENAGDWMARITGNDNAGQITKRLLGVIDSISDNLFTMGTGTALAGEGTKGAMRLVQLLMSGEATSNRMVELLDRNVDPTQAALYAVGDGVIEWITEKYSLEQIMGPDVKQLLGNKRALASFIGRSAAAEGSEEVASDILNMALDSVLSKIYDHETEIENRYNELVASGMGDREATQKAIAEKMEEVGWSFLAGALSGGMMAGGRVVMNSMNNRATGRVINDSSKTTAEGKTGAQRLYDLAMSMDEDTASRKLAEQIKATEGENVKVGDTKLGKLAQALAMDTQEKYNQTIQDTIAQDVEAKLAEAGVAGPQAKAYGEIITRSLFSGEMTKKDIQTLARNEQAIEVWKQYNVLSEEEMNLQKQIKENTKPQQSIMEEIGDLTSERAKSTSAAADEVEKSIRSTKTVEEALADLKTRRNDLMSDRFEEVAQQILKDNPQARKSKNFVDDVMKIRLAAMTLNENMPAVMLDAESARKLYEESRKEFDEIDEKRIVAQEQAKPGEGVTTFDGAEYGTKEWLEKVKGLTKTVKNQLGAIAEINARMGLKVNVVNDTENTNIYGFEDNDGTITINAAGMNRNGMNHHMLVTLSHEMTHWLEQNSREGYNALRKYVVDGLRKNGQNVEQMIVRTIDNQNMVLGAESGQSLDLNGAMAEIVAKGCENLLSSQTMANELKDTNPSLYTRIKTFVKDFVARLREAIKGMEGSLSFEARTLSDQTENIAKIWLGARQEALNREQQAEEQQEQPEEARQYSMAELDDEYSKAVEANDTEKEQEIVDQAAKDAGYTVKAYHGTGRADRVGTVFLPERATSGPMAYFTDSKEIAENYAKDKKDTSIDYDEEYGDYHSQFRYNLNGKDIPVSELWNRLDWKSRQKIIEAGKHINFDDELEEIIYDENAQSGPGGFTENEMRYHKGNAIDTLIYVWLDSANLWKREQDFLKVLELAGIKNVKWNNPDARVEKVYDTYLKINNPFDTTTMYTNDFVDGLLEWWDDQDQEKYTKESRSADFWDKNNVTVEEWADIARDDIERENTHNFTRIPDAVSDYIKSLGYDGIKDQGGKGGGESHTVWIPFTSEQIKSAEPVTYDDNGKVIPPSERFNEQKKDIRYSIEESPDMDVNNFMMGLQEHNLPMAQERTMLRQYKKLYSDTEAFRYFINELKGEIRKIEAKGNISAYDRMQLEKKQRMIDNYKARVERNQQELIKVTQSKGFASLMMKQHGRMTNLISGRTAGQLESTVEAMNAELENVSKEMAARKERLKKLGMAEGVLRARTQFNRAGLTRIAEQLKNELGSELSTKEIENRLALIALKMKQGSMDTENVQELADMISGRMTSQYEGYVISELRGSQITLSPVQLKELKASGSSLEEVRSKLAGTGIRVGTKGSVTLDQKWDSLCDMIPSLDRNENAGNMLNVLLDKVTAEKRDSGSDIFSDETQMKISESILKAANQLIPEIVTDQKSLALIRETLNYVREMSEETRSAAEGMDEINDLISRLQRTGRTATKQAGELTGNVNEAIDYFNALSEQSEAAMWQQERRDLIDQLKSENTQKLLEEQAKWNEKVINDKAARETIENNMRLRKKITTNVSRIRKLLVNESDQRNIPEHIKGLARELLEKIVDNDLLRRKISGIYEKDLMDLRRVLNVMKEQDGEFSEEDLRLMTDEEAQAVVMDALADLEDGIELYNERNGRDMMANITRYRDALIKMADAISTITNVINAERSISTIDRQIPVADAAEDIAKEMESSRFKGELTGRGSKAINTMRRTIVLGNTTPEYLIKNLRNKAFEMIWNEAKSGENRNGLETQKAQDYIHSLAEKTHYRDWVDKKYKVTLGGKQMELSIDNMMELYAIWKREHTTNPEMSQHLSIGGVYIQTEEDNKGKLRREKKEQRAVRVTDDEVLNMYKQMSNDQKDYLEGIVKYLSNEMSALGNEASMRMYGIKKYKESYYFPMKVWDGVKSARSDKGITGTSENRAANKSWSKRRMNMARNALVIGNFTQDAVNHIVEMINYNTMAPAIENINKVLNYKFVEGTDENDMTKRTLRIKFQQAYGLDTLNYLETLMKDMNGGVTQDQRKTLRDRALTIFKKNAVAGSMSVALQQPLSIIRAAMIINPKYLAASVNLATWKGSYTEMNKYSGVAVIKNMGRFDMNFGQSAKDYISPETKRSVYVATSDALTKVPQLMDTMTWTRMWTAVKMEQAAKHPDMDTKSDKFLNMVGERFNEVMRRTQVYDSILVKSSNMRSQNMGMKLITSFMAEPTLSLNVLADAVQNFSEKGGKANVIKAGAIFLLSAVMQAAVKAGMGTGRSPDKKKTGWENFLNKLVYNLINEGNPAGLIPGYSDLIEVLKTGELKDDAMGAIGKLFTIWQTGQKAVQKMAEGKGGDWYSWFRDLEDTAGQFAQLFTNIPAKNLMRDMRAMYNWISGSNYAKRESSAAVIKYQREANFFTADNLLGVLNAWLGEAGFRTTNTAYYNRIYNAMKEGDKQTAEDLKEYMTLGKGTSEDSITSGLKAAAKKDKDLTPAQQTEWMYDNNLMGDNPTATVTQQYKEGKITKAEATKLYRKLKPDMTDDEIWWKFDQMDYNKETGADVSGNDRYYRLKDAISENKVEKINKAVKDLLDHGVDQKKVKEKVNTEYKSEYLAADTNGRLQIRQAMHKVYKAIGLDAKEADKKIEEWKKEEQKKKKTK